MAEDNDGFILYADQKELFEQLPNEKAGELIKHIFKYVNDENPISEDLLINLAFTPIKQQLKRDLKKYESKKENLSNSGIEGNLKRWNIDLYNKYKDGEISLNDAVEIAKGRKVSPPDILPSPPIANIAVNDTVNVKDTVINNKNNIDFALLISFFNKTTGKSSRVVNDKTKKQFKQRLKEGYTKEDIQKAIVNCYNDKWHKDNNHKYLTLELISRPDKLEKYSTMKNNELTLSEKIRGVIR